VPPDTVQPVDTSISRSADAPLHVLSSAPPVILEGRRLQVAGGIQTCSATLDLSVNMPQK
jgi:hypothetical protein